MFFYTRPFFAHIIKERGPIAMGKNNGGPTKSERVPLSPSEQANRIRRAARAIQQGAEIKDLIARGFKAKEIADARAMIGKK